MNPAPESSEPSLAVGLLSSRRRVVVVLDGDFEDSDARTWPSGTYQFQRIENLIDVSGPVALRARCISLRQQSLADATFALTSNVGHQFHWAEDELQRFAGDLRIECDQSGLRVINDVPLETYLMSVVCSEMGAACPLELIKAHSVISRSWLLAQKAQAKNTNAPWQENDGGLRWYDQTAHAAFDVCAEDHCQRYHGLNRISTPTVREAIEQTRGEVLTYEGVVCDARYSKSCGGVTEDARTAWGDESVPYLVSFFDGAPEETPTLDLTTEQGFSKFLQQSPAAYCRCDDSAVLDMILPERDRRTTPAFFRWRERLDADQVRRWVIDKRGVDIGRPHTLEPLARGPSGRIFRLRVAGDQTAVILGKELEIRRVLSESHLLSSAFRVRIEGTSDAPEAFVLDGAGWGHGVGLCQIGAAVMAVEGCDYSAILNHYYPGSRQRRHYGRRVPAAS